MKSFARYLYIVAHSTDSNGLGVLCPVACAALIIGMLRARQVARVIIRRGVVRFYYGVRCSTTLDQGT
jgi:hypothetical protein